MISVEQVAQVTHAVNRAYCVGQGDNSQVPWPDAPDWQRDSAMAGVTAVLDGSATTPEEQHECWMRLKRDEGWVYGSEKDAEKKTHPCFMPYAELPPAQRLKDDLFRAVVVALQPQTTF